MNSPKLTIQIVGWNSAKDLPHALKALQEFPVNEVNICYIDNASSDNSCELVSQMLPNATIIKNSKNMGFSGGHNIGFAICQTPFVMLHNPDLVISWPAVSELLLAFENQKVGSVQGKLYRNIERTVIDSAGIEQTRSLNGRERGANQTDQGQFDAKTRILAATGACAMYRIEALKNISYPHNEFFDNDFFAYKEDVDLGWRLHKAGWLVQYIPVTLGVHKRAVGATGFMNWGLNPFLIFQRLRDSRTRYSLRNYVWMIIKNATVTELLTHSPFILTRLFIFLFLTIVYPPNILIWVEILKGMPKMLKKRQYQ